jgi:hypothetical protein
VPFFTGPQMPSHSGDSSSDTAGESLGLMRGEA